MRDNATQVAGTIAQGRSREGIDELRDGVRNLLFILAGPEF